MQKERKIRTYLVDDHTMMLHGIKSILTADPKIELVGSSSDAAQALGEISGIKPDLLITDYHMPEMSGLELIRALRSGLPDLKVIVLSMHEEAGVIKSLLREGVKGYVLKTDTHNDLLEAVTAVTAGNVYLSNKVNSKLLEILNSETDKPLLSAREHEILRLIAEEFSNKEIAERLFISERTVETHRKNIFRKTKTQSIVGLMKFAYGEGLI